MRKAAILTIAVFVALLAGCGHRHGPPPGPPTPSVAEGRRLWFAKGCYHCHMYGTSGGVLSINTTAVDLVNSNSSPNHILNHVVITGWEAENLALYIQTGVSGSDGGGGGTGGGGP